MSAAIAPATLKDLTEEVREIFAQVTRYPMGILDPAASLEEDLGIDSVKVGEVFGLLREKYNLSDKLNIPRENLRNIGSVAAGLKEFLAQNYSPSLSAAPPRNGNAKPDYVSKTEPAPASGIQATMATAAITEDLDQSVRGIFAEVTRYPLEILEPSASLEEDLGIDSVKVG